MHNEESLIVASTYNCAEVIYSLLLIYVEQ